MYVIAKMSSGLYGRHHPEVLNVDDLGSSIGEETLCDIQHFHDQGEAVILVADLMDIGTLGIDPDSVEIVEAE